MKKVSELKLIEGDRAAIEKELVECLFTHDMQKFELLKQQLEAISLKEPTLTLIHKKS